MSRSIVADIVLVVGTEISLDSKYWVVANLLAHCLSAMALQSAMNPFLGAGFISESSFFAGIIGMLIHLDSDKFNGGRTPYMHSVLLGSFYSFASAAIVYLVVEAGLLNLRTIIPFLTVIPAGFCSHILVDAFTSGGIYLFPDTPRVNTWFDRRPDSENSWIHWKKWSLSSSRMNDDPVLNLTVSSASLALLLVLLALTPL